MSARAKAALPGLVILLGGLLALWGSYGPWELCMVQPCEGEFGLPYVVSWGGFEFGTGVATAIVAVGLVLIGVASLRRDESPVIHRVTIVLAMVEFLLVGIHVARFHVLSRNLVFGPEIGLIAVIAGTALGAVGGAFLRARNNRLSSH
jgi:hypothetical protein